MSSRESYHDALSSSPISARPYGEPFWRRREFVIGAALVLLTLGMGIVRPDFLTWPNLRDNLVNASLPAVAAAGMTALIVSAEIDISVGRILAVSAVAVAMLGQKGWPVPALLAAAVLTGALLGAVNGALTAGLKIPSIVATLATMGALRGLLVLTTRGETIPVPDALSNLGASSPLGLPFLVWAALGVSVGMGIYLASTRSGRQHYAVGSNPRSAALSGLPVGWITFRSFVLLGALVGVAGFLYACRFSPLSQPIGSGFELVVITAVVVGGTDIFGGRGTVLGTALAAVLLSTIGTALTFLQSYLKSRFAIELPSEVQPAIQGLLILAAVLYNSLSRKEEGG